MEWRKLFSRKRLGEETLKEGKLVHGRSVFQRDFDRIVFSSAFQRLQKKTQVHPIPANDSIHNRLTHSLEAASVGRSLGAIVGRTIINDNPKEFKNKDNVLCPDDFAEVVAAACLAHDIGNPPFGHSGEKAIAEHFSRRIKSASKDSIFKKLTLKQQADLKGFQGNGLGFRILTHTQPSQSKLSGGFSLTYATLGAFTKYPRESLAVEKLSNSASAKSFGFFQTEKEVFKQIARELGLESKDYGNHYGWCRHPLAFLVEAADDICYRVIDLEDGYRLRLIDFAEIKLLLRNIVGDNAVNINKIMDNDKKIAYLRAVAINNLVRQVSDCFLANIKKILEGSFDSQLIECIPEQSNLEKIKEVTIKYIYGDSNVIQIEAAGFEVLPSLLKAFIDAVGGKTEKDRKIRQLIPAQYLDKGHMPFKDNYTNIVSITEFVSGMTDTHAIDTYRSIKGISMPNY